MPPEVTHVLVQAKQARDPRLAALFETIYDANISKIYNGEYIARMKRILIELINSKVSYNNLRLDMFHLKSSEE